MLDLLLSLYFTLGFADRTELLNRCKLDVEAFDIRLLPSKSQLIAAAWMAGDDVSSLVSRATPASMPEWYSLKVA